MPERIHAQRAPTRGPQAPSAGPPLAQAIQGASGGRTLDTGARHHLEGAFGHSFGHVRIHADAEADQLADAVDARAFTTGSDIFFRAGAYDPNSPQGLHLLAHESAHTLQQARGPVSGTPGPEGVSVSNRNDGFERAAREAADRAVTGVGGSLWDSVMPSATSAGSHMDSLVVQREDPQEGFHLDTLPPTLHYGQHLLGGGLDLHGGLGGLGADYTRGPLAASAGLSFGGQGTASVGYGAPLMPWMMDVQHDLGQGAAGMNSVMNGGGLMPNLGNLGGFGALGDVAGAGAPSPYSWGVGLQGQVSSDEQRIMAGLRLNF